MGTFLYKKIAFICVIYIFSLFLFAYPALPEISVKIQDEVLHSEMNTSSDLDAYLEGRLYEGERDGTTYYFTKDSFEVRYRFTVDSNGADQSDRSWANIYWGSERIYSKGGLEDDYNSGWRTKPYNYSNSNFVRNLNTNHYISWNYPGWSDTLIPYPVVKTARDECENTTRIVIDSTPPAPLEIRDDYFNIRNRNFHLVGETPNYNLYYNLSQENSSVRLDSEAMSDTEVGVINSGLRGVSVNDVFVSFSTPRRR